MCNRQSVEADFILVNKLSEKSTQYMQEKKSLDFMLSEAHLELSQLKSKYNKLVENMTTQVDSVEHDEEVERILRYPAVYSANLLYGRNLTK